MGRIKRRLARLSTLDTNGIGTRCFVGCLPESLSTRGHTTTCLRGRTRCKTSGARRRENMGVCLWTSLRAAERKTGLLRSARN